MIRSTILLASALALSLSGAASAQGKVFLTVDEALALAFPKCEFTQETQFLSKSEVAAVRERARETYRRAVVRRWVARNKAGKVVGTAYIDAHRVRTMRETVMVVVKPDSTIGRIELLAFGEPTDYVPRPVWYRQFDGRRLDSQLHLKRGVKGVTGATLTAVATTSCARRMLAVHGVIASRDAAEEREIEKAVEKK